jgi:hypothetical protein
VVSRLPRDLLRRYQEPSLPRGEVHAWTPGANQTLRGLLLHGSRLDRYPHVEWADVQTESGRHADAVCPVCLRCTAAGTGAADRAGPVCDGP